MGCREPDPDSRQRSSQRGPWAGAAYKSKVYRSDGANDAQALNAKNTTNLFISKGRAILVREAREAETRVAKESVTETRDDFCDGGPM